jgi:hypothetical protein
MVQWLAINLGFPGRNGEEMASILVAWNWIHSCQCINNLVEVKQGVHCWISRRTLQKFVGSGTFSSVFWTYFQTHHPQNWLTIRNLESLWCVDLLWVQVENTSRIYNLHASFVFQSLNFVKDLIILMWCTFGAFCCWLRCAIHDYFCDFQFTIWVLWTFACLRDNSWLIILNCCHFVANSALDH